MKRQAKPKFIPNPEQMALMPDISGNEINGLGETEVRRSSPIYWQSPELTPFGPLMSWFYDQVPDDERMKAVQIDRAQTLAIKIPPMSPIQQEKTPEEWTPTDHRGRAPERGQILSALPAYGRNGLLKPYQVPHQTIIMVAVAMDYEELKTAPEIPAAVEVIRQYDRGHRVSRALASWIHQQGWSATPYGGSGNVPLLLIPPALECGFGELGKHGSLINREFGSTLRLAAVRH